MREIINQLFSEKNNIKTVYLTGTDINQYYQQETIFDERENYWWSKKKNQILGILEGKDFKIYKNNQNKIRKFTKLQIIVESFDEDVNEKFHKMIQNELSKLIINYQLDIPYIPQIEIQSLTQFLQDNSIQINGDVKQGQRVSLMIFDEEQQAIDNYIDKLKISVRFYQYYPSEWEWQQKNYYKVKLSTDNPEYTKIQTLFKQTDNGVIYEINRIQNKILWDNYTFEKKKLIDRYNQNGQPLQEIEKERYLWHGVRGQHPKVIYEGSREAFDATYSNIGSYGPGIYFAQNASYSRDYAYTLKQNEDTEHCGRLVFLCCLLTTGKEEAAGNQNTKRPSSGFDCVSIGGIFVLYSMDVRRAYPAYEVIFK